MENADRVKLGLGLERRALRNFVWNASETKLTGMLRVLYI